jgi:hypothetical protein
MELTSIRDFNIKHIEILAICIPFSFCWYYVICKDEVRNEFQLLQDSISCDTGVRNRRKEFIFFAPFPNHVTAHTPHEILPTISVQGLFS